MKTYIAHLKRTLAYLEYMTKQFGSMSDAEIIARFNVSPSVYNAEMIARYREEIAHFEALAH